MSVKLEAGQWYRRRDMGIVYCIGQKPKQARQSHPWIVCSVRGSTLGYLSDGTYSIQVKEHVYDIVEHLPGCTGFDWEPPKPVVAPEGWRLLTEGETVLVTDHWWDGKEWKHLPDATLHAGKSWNEKQFHPMARKIEPKYRPFKNAEEFKPERERWLRHKIDKYVTRVTCFTDANVWVGAATVGTSYRDAYECFVFIDGTPFGVRVDD